MRPSTKSNNLTLAGRCDTLRLGVFDIDLMRELRGRKVHSICGAQTLLLVFVPLLQCVAGNLVGLWDVKIVGCCLGESVLYWVSEGISSSFNKGFSWIPVLS